VEIVATYRFSRDDSCHKLGLRHPAYLVMEKMKELGPGQALEVVTDDYDWALTIEMIAKGANYGIERGEAGSRG
jgi:uncharacterized protein (DUF2249 family)